MGLPASERLSGCMTLLPWQSRHHDLMDRCGSRLSEWRSAASPSVCMARVLDYVNSVSPQVRMSSASYDVVAAPKQILDLDIHIARAGSGAARGVERRSPNHWSVF